MATMKLDTDGHHPLLMHSDRFGDPLDPMTKAHKALTSKRKKPTPTTRISPAPELLGRSLQQGQWHPPAGQQPESLPDRGGQAQQAGH